ncbi:MAG: PQQ-binding-like beta-propeller repeat protein [Firmicutes bacterium]|jgi:hypothetical protein|nr:PQQ-binding-like beta-propeller repeat protein [Bacillota bacterium]
MKKIIGKRMFTIFLTLAIIVTMIPMMAFAGEATNLEWYNFRNNAENNGVVNKTTPVSADTASLKWSNKYGTGWSAAPTPPLIIDGYIYVGMSNKVVKIDKNTGDKVAESDEMVANVGFAMNPITYADGKFFVQVGNGMIQAIDYETLKCVWHTEKIGGQTVSPISYTKINGKGYIYIGTWKSESNDGALLCISTDDSNVDENKIKKTEWRFIPSGKTDTLQNIVYNDTTVTCDEEIRDAVDDGTASRRGFYWAGAYACEKFIAIGSDDGTREGDYQANACFYTINPKTGEIIDKIGGIKGDIRTTVVYDKGNLYFCTKGGLVYRVPVDENGKLGQAKVVDMGGMITASPVVYNGRIYVGVAGTGGQFNPDGGHVFAVIDSESMTRLHDLPIKGYPQASALLSTAYENEDFDGDGKADGRVYIYFTYNAKPGGIYYTYDAKDEANIAKESGNLFIPESSLQNYCISTICTDSDGTLYYKNDSCYLMAVQNNVAYISDMTVAGAKSWSKAFAPGVTNYEVVLEAGTKSTNVKLALPLEVKATVDGENYDANKGVDVALDNEGKASVDIVATADGGSTTYTVDLRCEGTDSSLKNLYISGSNIFGEGQYALSPSFEADKTDYTVDVQKIEKNFYNIWPEISDENASVKVYPVENVNPSEINSEGTINIASSIEGHDRYAVYPKDKSKNCKVRVEVTSERGQEVTSYNVSFVKDKSSVFDKQNQGDKNTTVKIDNVKSDLVKTGDNSNLTIWIIVLVLVLATLVLVYRKARQENRRDKSTSNSQN